MGGGAGSVPDCLVSLTDGYTTDELDFVWHPHKNPLKMRKNLVLPEFEITGKEARNCDANFTTGINNPHSLRDSVAIW